MRISMKKVDRYSGGFFDVLGATYRSSPGVFRGRFGGRFWGLRQGLALIEI